MCARAPCARYLAEAKASSFPNGEEVGSLGFDVCLEMMASANLVDDVGLMRRHGVIGIIGSKVRSLRGSRCA